MAWTEYAEKSEFIEYEGTASYFKNVPNGNYVATGRDVNDRPIRREYTVNSRIDSQSKWAMWNDFCGRFGLTNLWIIKDDGSRKLIWRQY